MTAGSVRAVTAVEPGLCCSPLSACPLPRPEAERLAKVLKALADPARLQLLSLVQAGPNEEACVCDLTATMDLTQPTVSHHLKVLVDAGLLTRERRGTWAWFALVPERLDEVRRLLH